jgi:hypothetical protein
VYDLLERIEESELYKFATEAHNARFPAYAWKAVACEHLGILPGSKPTPAQIVGLKSTWGSMWLELTLRFDRMTTVRWAEHLECEEERIHNTLRYLGSSPQQVAERLAMMGIMGTRMESCDCPLSHFFAGMYGAWFVRTFRADVYVDFMVCANPLAIEHTVHAFDDGETPELNLFPDADVTV